MYTKEQIEIALKEYERLGSVQAVINLLEYPSSNTLYRWYERKLAEKTNYHGSLDREGGADIFLDYFMLLIQDYVCTLPDSYSPVTA